MAEPTTPGEVLHPIPYARAGCERETLVETLHNLRAVVAWKLAGLDDESAKASLVSSLTTPLGVVNHLAWVEAWWFQEVFTKAEVDYPFDWDDDADAEFRMTDDHTVANVLRVYEDNVLRSNEIIADAESLESTVRRGEREFSLRWILTHMIDETARHAGHMDILREQIDGATGYRPPSD